MDRAGSRVSVSGCTIRAMTSRDGTGIVELLALATSTPDGFDVVQWRRVNGSLQQAHPGPGLLSERLWEAPPVRKGSQYPNRRSQSGLYFWSATGEHVRYESGLELAGLVDLDQRGEVVLVGARPLRLLFCTGACTAFHDPDFLAVDGNGDQVLYDVCSEGRITDSSRRRFNETDRLCKQVGWQHRVLTDPSPTRVANLGFLRPSRLSRCHPKTELFEQLRRVFAGGRGIGQGAAMVNGRQPAIVMPYVKHLIWHRRLMVDLNVRLDFDAVAATGREEAGPCCG